MEENERDMIELQKLGLNEPVTVTDENKHRNDGKWCKAFREAQQIKQYAIGQELNEITQQAVSKIEKRKILPDNILEVYARLCRVEVGMIKNMPEINVGSASTFNDQAQQLNAEQLNNNITFNPIDKVVELCKDKDNLHREVIDAKNEQIQELKKIQEQGQAYSQQILSLLSDLKKG